MSAPPPWHSCPCSSVAPAHEVGFSPLARTCFSSCLVFCTVTKLLASFTVTIMASGLSVKVGLSLLGLYPWWGKLRLVTSPSPPSFIVMPKALALACLSAVARLFAILLPSSSRFCPPAPYCYTLLPGWHPTASRRLAPYCYTSAGTLLLIVVGWHLLCPVAPLTYLSPPIV